MAIEENKYLIVVVGPTAVGKTSFCVELAKALQTEVVNADSRQVYREMEIGTAKPTVAEQEGVPHHLVDFLSINEPYTAGKYEQDALNVIAELHQKSNRVILSGGTGLYVKAVCEGLDDIPSSEEARAKLNTLYEAQGITPLLDELAEKDPVHFEQVDQHNPHRVIRALEVIRASGKPYSAFRKQAPQARPFTTLKIGLNRDREELYERINRRVDIMRSEGLEAEAKALYAQKQFNALQTVGYQELFDYWDGKLADIEEAYSLIKRNSRRYAKRQLTWFRRDEEVNWFHPDQLKEVQSFIAQKLAEG